MLRQAVRSTWPNPEARAQATDRPRLARNPLKFYRLWYAFGAAQYLGCWAPTGAARQAGNGSIAVGLGLDKGQRVW